MYKIIYVRPITRELSSDKLEKTLTASNISNFYLDLVYYSDQLPTISDGIIWFNEALRKGRVILSGNFIVTQLDHETYKKEIELAKEQQTQWLTPPPNTDAAVQTDSNK